MSAEINSWYPEVKPIGPQTFQQKGVSAMGFWKKLGIGMLAGVLISGGFIVADVWHQYQNKEVPSMTAAQKVAEKVKLANQTPEYNEQELQIDERIQKYCYGWPWEKDTPTCKSWKWHYRHLKEYSDLPAYKEIDRQIAQLQVNGIQASIPGGDITGNAQSPALH